MQKRKALSSDEAFLLSERFLKISLITFKPQTEKVHIFIPIEKFNEMIPKFSSVLFKQNIRVFVPKDCSGSTY
jgi:5-formyltetrahydrofolate cyclo-ligase